MTESTIPAETPAKLKTFTTATPEERDRAERYLLENAGVVAECLRLGLQVKPSSAFVQKLGERMQAVAPDVFALVERCHGQPERLLEELGIAFVMGWAMEIGKS